LSFLPRFSCIQAFSPYKPSIKRSKVMRSVLSRITAVTCSISLIMLVTPPVRAAGQAPDAEHDAVVRGVNPADNISKYEILPKFTRLSDQNDISVSSLTLKYDLAIRKVYGINVELPLSQFSSSFSDASGNGDINIRGRYQTSSGRWSGIVGAELVVPLASDDQLGSGKWQTNPVVSAVYAFSAQSFGVLVAKQFFSIAGDNGRADIRQGQYRIIFANTSKSGWWVLLDPQLYVDYTNNNRAEFGPEIEIGKMVGQTTGLWLRGGGHAAGSWDRQDYSIGGGVRFIVF
jgi:hypothetical protein